MLNAKFVMVATEPAQIFKQSPAYDAEGATVMFPQPPNKTLSESEKAGDAPSRMVTVNA